LRRSMRRRTVRRPQLRTSERMDSALSLLMDTFRVGFLAVNAASEFQKRVPEQKHYRPSRSGYRVTCITEAISGNPPAGNKTSLCKHCLPGGPLAFPLPEARIGKGTHEGRNLPTAPRAPARGPGGVLPPRDLRSRRNPGCAPVGGGQRLP